MKCAMIIFVYVIFLLQLWLNISGEYYILDGKIPSYLYHKFENVEDEIFPSDIKINMSLNRLSGILLYSIDRKLNQLVVSLNDYISPALVIQFRKQSTTINLSDLCKCKICRYEILTLKIQIKKNILLQCNTGDVKDLQFRETVELDTNYPIPYKYSNIIPDVSGPAREAQMWLVNRPQYDNIYPNMDQLTGCIFNVLYGGQSIIFSNISNNIERRCTPVCNGTICNGGKCLESYNGSPICNCTLTFRGGVYCDDEMAPLNIRSISQLFQFDMFKLSWKSSALEIFILAQLEKNRQIKLYREKNVLLMEYKSVNGMETVVKGTLYMDYEPNKEYICIGKFFDTYIDVEIITDGFTQRSVIQTNRNLRGELFDSILIRSGNGSIYMSYKTEKEIKWNKVNFKRNTSIMDEYVSFTKNETETIKDPRQRGNIAGIVILIILTVITPIILITFCVQTLLKKRPDTMPDEEFEDKCNIINDENKQGTSAIKELLDDRVKSIDTNLNECIQLKKSISKSTDKTGHSEKKKLLRKLASEMEKIEKINKQLKNLAKRPGRLSSGNYIFQPDGQIDTLKMEEEIPQASSSGNNNLDSLTEEKAELKVLVHSNESA